MTVIVAAAGGTHRILLKLSHWFCPDGTGPVALLRDDSRLLAMAQEMARRSPFWVRPPAVVGMISRTDVRAAMSELEVEPRNGADLGTGSSCCRHSLVV